jgi:hypothetical protein
MSIDGDEKHSKAPFGTPEIPFSTLDSTLQNNPKVKILPLK